MKIAISLITLGIFQVACGSFYAFLAPIRVEENIQTNLERARAAAREELKKEVSPEFPERWPKEFENYVWGKTRNAESLAETAERGWNALQRASLLLLGSGFLTILGAVGILKDRSSRHRQPM